MRTRYLEGRSVAALARDHGVSRGAIRTAVADLLPARTADDPSAPAPELPVVLDMPGKVADLEAAERVDLDQGGRTARPGLHPARQRHPAVHRQLLIRCQSLGGTPGAPALPAQRKACREYENRAPPSRATP